MSDMPTYVDNARVRQELGGLSYSTFARWRKKPGFPKPKKNGLWKWTDIEAWMDGRSQRTVSSPPLSQEEEIRHAAKTYSHGF